MARGKLDSSSIHLFCEHMFDSRRDYAIVLRYLLEGQFLQDKIVYAPVPLGYRYIDGRFLIMNNMNGDSQYSAAVKDGVIAIMSISALVLTINFGIITFNTEKSNSQAILESIKIPIIISGLCLIGSMIIGGVTLSSIFRKTYVQSYSLGVQRGFNSQFWTFIIGLIFMFVAILTRFGLFRM